MYNDLIKYTAKEQTMMKQMQIDKLTVKIMDSRAEMGRIAAQDIRAVMEKLLEEKAEINMIVAAAPSQNEVLAELCTYTDLAWDRVNAFHMDEYIGLPKSAPQCFSNFLVEHIFSKLPFKSVNLICSENGAEAECARYGKLLAEHSCDIVVMGIGENGHIAFNDPWVADFRDPAAIKPVMLDEVCRNQQVHDGCFETLEDVPTHALTLTCPTLMGAAYQFCVVPAPTKAKATARMLTGEISEECPATALRRAERAALYLDPDSASLL